jgi:hypothetical protein
MQASDMLLWEVQLHTLAEQAGRAATLLDAELPEIAAALPGATREEAQRIVDATREAIDALRLLESACRIR